MENGITFTDQNKDSEKGYPGNLNASVLHHLSEENTLIIENSAFSRMDTICNLTNYSYFNAMGHQLNSILDYYMKIHAHFFTYFNEESLPTVF